jgi:hypothetical protein
MLEDATVQDLHEVVMQQSEKMSAAEENRQGVMPVIGIVTDPNEEF